MKQAVRQTAVCAVLLIIFSIVCRLTVFKHYTAYIPLFAPNNITLTKDDLLVTVENPDVLHCRSYDMQDNCLCISVTPYRQGEATILITHKDGTDLSVQPVYVDRFLTVYNRSSGDFTGDSGVLICLSLFWFLLAAIMLWHFSRAKGPSFYSYDTIYFSGFSLFAFVNGLLLFDISRSHILHPFQYPMFMAYSVINSASSQFMLLTIPLVVIFSLAMMISNLVLLRHEKTRIKNIVGLLISFILLIGEGIGWYLFSKDFSGSERELRLYNTMHGVYSTIFVYFECMLIGSIISGLKAAKHTPLYDKDFILILGCWFRKDGSLPPLLRGRVDKAIAFWHQQKETTGKEAFLIPSGGQGPDESMPEAEAMRRYLLSQHIPDDLILPETRSKNTFENMAFSRDIIQRINPDGNVIFATTNYHVFRSGLWAANANLKAEGIGSSTKWWYWPNAFMRECIGLLQRQWKRELLYLIVLILFFATLSMVV